MTLDAEEPPFKDRVGLYGFGAKERAAFPRVLALLKDHAPKALDQIYAAVAATPHLARLFRSDDAVARARKLQEDHWYGLFAGRIDDPGFLDRAHRIGFVHARVGLHPTWYIGAYARTLELLLDSILSRWPLRWFVGPRLRESITTLVKGAMFDMDLSLDAYARTENQQRQSVIAAVERALADLAKGDTCFAPLDLPPEYARLAQAIEQTRQRINGTVLDLKGAAESIDARSSGLRSATDDLALRTGRTARSLGETAASLDDMTETVRRTATGAKEVSALVVSTYKEAEAGGSVVSAAIEAMSDIEASSAEVSRILNLIDEISFQTNLLAVNARVEAARAGEAGKGFAEVASEVRALSQRSSDAAQDIRGLISNSSAQVARGVDLVGQTGASLVSIVTALGEIADRATEISETSATQSSGLGQINDAVHSMDDATRANAAMVGESRSATESLSGEVAQLMALVSQFRVDEEADASAGSADRKVA